MRRGGKLPPHPPSKEGKERNIHARSKINLSQAAQQRTPPAPPALASRGDSPPAPRILVKIAIKEQQKRQQRKSGLERFPGREVYLRDFYNLKRFAEYLVLTRQTVQIGPANGKTHQPLDPGRVQNPAIARTH